MKRNSSTTRVRDRATVLLKDVLAHALIASVFATVAVCAAQSAGPQPSKAQPAANAPDSRAAPADVSVTRPLAEQYCQSFVDQAREARAARQAAELKALASEVDARLAKLDAAIAEIKEWVARRAAFSDRAGAQLVGIYAAMRPEAASQQMVRMDELTATAVLSKLDSRQASAILNEMPAEKAARLAAVLSLSARKSDARPKP